MIRRLPKRGFNNPMKTQFHLVNLSDLARFEAGSSVAAEQLEASRLIKKVKYPIKLLGRGVVEIAVHITVHAASEAAIAAVQAAGGTVTVLGMTRITAAVEAA